MPSSKSRADLLRRGDAAAATELAQALIKPLNNNLVPRPWGGSRMLAYKGLDAVPEAIAKLGQPVGEAFELAAFDADAEAERYPSLVELADRSVIELPELLAANASEILGDAFVACYGSCLPLLPKTLDIAELLSVQGHPPGNTEAYIIIDADPGATIRLGFAADVDAAQLRDELAGGRGRQSDLATLLGARCPDLGRAQRVLGPWLAARGAPPEDVEASVTGLLESDSDWPAARALLEVMKGLYWRVLDGLNVVPVSAGQVIHNATPARLVGARGSPCAEVHALGNPEGKAILALEVRRPGPTFRAWDNVRFPIRNVDIDAALDALNLEATTVDDFMVFPELVPGRPGVFCSVEGESFRVEHLRPSGEQDNGVAVPDEGPHCLHVISGAAEFAAAGSRPIGSLRRGESALVPVGVGAYVAKTSRDDTEIVKVTVPL